MSEQQGGPVMDGSGEATADEQLRGILAQVRADAAQHPGEDAAASLRQRLADSNIEVPQERIEELTSSLGDSPLGDPHPGAQSHHAE